MMMSRFTLLLFTALAAVPLQAQAPKAASRTAAPPSGEYTVSVRQFGATADDKTDNADAFQKAVDHLAAKIEKEIGRGSGYKPSGVVFVPAAAGAYRIGRPIWVDHPYIEIRGEGRGSRVRTFPARSHPLFLFGLRRRASIKVGDKHVGNEATSKYRPDLFGRLDASAAPNAGMRGGFRTHGEALIQAQAGPLTDGARHSRQDWSTDHWREAKALTVELAVEGPNGGVMPAGVPIFTIGVPNKNLAYPLCLTTERPNHYVVKFSTQDKAFEPQSHRRFEFDVPEKKGMRRIAFQIDLENAKVAAFVDGVETAATELLGKDWRPGLHFAENDYFPLLIADDGGDRPALGRTLGHDWTLAGFLMSRAARYEKRGAGQRQTRSDDPSRPIDDLYRYFTPQGDDSEALGHFAFTDAPDVHGRLLTIQGGPAASGHTAAAFLLHGMQNQEGGIPGNALRDIALIGSNLYGQNVAVAQVIDLQIRGLTSSASYHAVGSLNHGANYFVKLENCVFDANDSGYYGLDQGVWARNIEFVNAGRATIRLVASVANMENLFVSHHNPQNESTIKLHSGDYGGNYSFRNVIVDYEGNTYLQTPVYAEIHPFAAETSLRLTDFFLGTVGEGIPVVTLKEGVAKEFRKRGYLAVDGLQVMGKHVGPVVEVEGPAWRGGLRGVSLGETKPVVSVKGERGAPSDVKLVD